MTKLIKNKKQIRKEGMGKTTRLNLNKDMAQNMFKTWLNINIKLNMKLNFKINGQPLKKESCFKTTKKVMEIINCLHEKKKDNIYDK